MKGFSFMVLLVGTVLGRPQQTGEPTPEIDVPPLVGTAIEPTLPFELYLPPSITTPVPPPFDYLPPTLDALPSDYLPPSLDTPPNDYLPPLNDYLPPNLNDYVPPSSRSIHSQNKNILNSPLSSQIMKELLRRGRSSLFTQKDMTQWIDMIQQIMSKMKIQLKRC